MTLLLQRLSSPIGQILLVTDGEAVRALDFHDYEMRMRRLLRRHYGTDELASGVTPGIAERVQAYFDGAIASLDDLPVRTGGTPFQRKVWAALRGIPYGVTMSYGALATRLGSPNGSRAVGLANGQNPVAVIVPCHRVIGAGGQLTGFGGGLARKAWLLSHEAGTHGAPRLL